MNMARTVGIGHQDFEKLRMKKIFYVDKTGFIQEWWDADDDVTQKKDVKRWYDGFTFGKRPDIYNL